MSAGQWKSGLIVIKARRFPSCGCVALRTVVAEVILRMVRIGGLRVIDFVAGITIRRSSRILPVFVALFTGDRLMRARQRKRGLVVIELSGRPGFFIVAG